jgi:hypothetical protein
MDKLLIYEDNGQKQTFRLACETTAAQANDLINVFESYQDLAEITTSAEFEQLVADPIGYYDEVLRTGLNLQTPGNRTPDPETLAKLFSYDRPNYKKSIQGMPITEDCEGCKTKKIVRKTKAAITSARWEAYRDYLTFTPSGFKLNEAEIEKHCERFKIFAESESQRAIHKHFTDLVEILNSHADQYPLPDRVKEATAKAFNLGLSQGISGDFIVDKQFISNLIANNNG